MFTAVVILAVLAVGAGAFFLVRSLGRKPPSPSVMTAPPREPAPIAGPAVAPDEEVTEETLAVSSTKPFLKKTSGPGGKDTLYLSSSGITSIGRSPDNVIVLPEEAASSKHCVIEKLGNSYLLTDLGSTNKTWVNGKAQARVELKNGDEIKVGDTTMVFALFGDRR